MFQNSYLGRASLLSGLKKINWSSLLNNTQKTLNIINQAIPIVYQVRPIVTNAKTFVKVFNAFKNEANTNNSVKSTPKQTSKYAQNSYSNRPVFYI